ncbi:hypothetical protein M2138_000905 [Dysgonomonadaceae bacterium PH5-43]|nr:hypothetical protein [Dysgonomonadaceae bacterium PH5-43]
MKQIVCLLLLVMFISCSPKHDYNLKFTTANPEDMKWNISSGYALDTTETINGKHPIVFETKQSDDTVQAFSAIVYQQIALPSKQKDTDQLFVSINNKCSNLTQACLQIYCLDNENNISFGDTINILNSSGWNKRSLLLPLGNVSHLLIGVYAFGEWTDAKNISSQKLWIDKIDIKLNGEDIENVRYNQPQPLTCENKQLDESLIQEKRIVGIANGDLDKLKLLVENNKCKIIFFDTDFYSALLWNLYVEGRLNNSSALMLNEQNDTDNQLFDFLTWLREYNTTQERKVRVYGLVEYLYDEQINPLYYYVKAFDSKDTESHVIKELLSLLETGNYGEAKELVRNNNELREVLDNNSESDLLYALSQKEVYSPNIKFSVYSHRRLNAEFGMYGLINRFMKQYITNSELAVVFSTPERLNAKPSSHLFPYINPLGFVLKRVYGKQFDVVY